MDVICVFGFCPQLYEKTLPWLMQDFKRRLVFIEERPGILPVIEHPRVKTYFLQTPLQLELFAKKIAWSAVFLKVAVYDVSHSPYFLKFKEMFESTHAIAELLLSDAADFGSLLVAHAKRNLEKPFRSLMDMKNAFEKIPAILVGAGPSLEKNRHLLPFLRDSALIFAGGSALEKMPCPPHFGACIDKEKQLGSIPFPNVPFCFQARMHPDCLNSVRGERLLAPDSHFSFLNYLAGEKNSFESGWTVGNFLVALAIYLGCDPIVVVGMDYCYQDGKKYAFDSSTSSHDLVQTQDKKWTQRDWMMAVSWMRSQEKQYPGRTFLNATEGGLPYFTPKKLQDLCFTKIQGLQDKVDSVIRKTPLRNCSYFKEWECSLLEKQGVALASLLEPMWCLWRPLIEREAELDAGSPSLEEKMQLHEQLFYERVIQEHLHVLT